jgi:outer membrane receptor protein involved in Fe transport
MSLVALLVRSWRLLLIALLFLPLPAQSPLSGLVSHAAKPVPGALITATQDAQKWTTTTGSDGAFSFPQLPPGPLQLEVRLFGFAPLRQSVTPDQRRLPVNLGLSLQPFTANAPAPARPAAAPANGENVEAQVARALETAPAPLLAIDQSDASESFLVQGSLSRGLQEAERPAFFEFGPGGPGGMMMLGDAPPGMGAPGMGPEGGMPAGTPASPGAMGGMTGGMPGGRGGGMPGGGPGGMRGGGPGMGQGMGPGMGPGMSPEEFAKLPKEKKDKLLEEQNERRRMIAERFGVNRREGFGNRSRRTRDQIRGGAFLSAGNDAFDATPFALNGRAAVKPDYAQYRFGASLGGPISLGKIFTPTTSFFFFNYNGNRGDQTYNRYAVQPTLALRSGDFSTLTGGKATTIYDPQSRAPFPGNRIPDNRISSIATGLLPFIPLPNQPTATQNYRFTTIQPQVSDNLSLRLNRTLTRKDRLAFSLSWQRRVAENVQLYGWRDSNSGNGSNSSLSWSRNFSPRLIHNVQLRYNRNYNALNPYFAYGPDAASILGIKGTSRDPANFGPPNLNFTNFGDLTDGNRSRRNVHTWNFSDGWTFVRKAHTLTAGFDFSRVQQNTLSDPNARGLLFFGGLATSAFDSAGLPLPKTGNDFADFLLGYVQQSSIRFGAPDSYMRQSNYGVFVQDEWRARPNLTFNLGLRYDDWEPFTEKYNRLANLALNSDFTAAAVVTPGSTSPFSGSIPSGLIRADRNNLSPRLGFSWRPFPKKRTILRGGYSLFFDGSTYSRIPSRLVYQPPFATSSTFNTSTAAPLFLSDPFNGPDNKTILNTYAVNPDYRVPYAQTWSFSVQHEIQGHVVELGLLGTKGTALVVQRIPNRAPPGSPATSEDRRPIPYATGFTYDSPDGSSIFNAGQLRVTRRMRRGLNWGVLYTYGKSIDNASSIGGSGNTVVQDDKNLAAERGLSAFDIRHNLQFNAMLASPFGPSGIWLRQRNLLTNILRDWNLMTSINANSGRPLTATVLGSVADAGGSGATGSARADATGLPIDMGSGYFNPAAFSIPPGDRYGNAGRNTIPGPGSFVLNTSFGRSFQLGENSRHRLDGRVEANNLLNHVNITGYGTVVNSANYSLATQAGQMRSLQLTLRLRF